MSINTLAVYLTELELFHNKGRELTYIQRFKKHSGCMIVPEFPFLSFTSLTLFCSPRLPLLIYLLLHPLFLSFLSLVLLFPFPYLFLFSFNFFSYFSPPSSSLPPFLLCNCSCCFTYSEEKDESTSGSFLLGLRTVI